MADEARIDKIGVLVAYRLTDEEARLDKIGALVAYRFTDQTARLDKIGALIAYRVLRTWEDIPGAKKLWFPGGLEAPEDNFYLREHRVTIGTGRIGGGRVDIVADERCTVWVNGARYIDYVADADNAPVRSYDIPASMLHNGANLFAFKVTRGEGYTIGILEYKITVF